MNKLGFERITQKSSANEALVNAEASFGAKIWSLVTFKGKIGSNIKNIGTTVTIPFYSEADVDAIVEALKETNCILFLDDLEKTNEETKVMIAHLGKKLSDSAALSTTESKVVYAGISQEFSKLIAIDQSLRDRLADHLLHPLNDPEISRILINGWGSIGFTWREINLDDVAILCCGYARYAHWIGKQAALNAFRNGRNTINEADINIAINFIIDKYRDYYQTSFDKATGHKTGLRLRERILYAMAISPEIEVHIDFILQNCSRMTGQSLIQNQISGPLGELKKPRRDTILESGRTVGFHRFRDLMIKPYIRMLMKQNGVI